MPSRVLKKVHLQRPSLRLGAPRALATLRRTRQYASRLHPSSRMGTRRAALPFGGLTVPSEVEGHLDLFEPPEGKRVFQDPVRQSRLPGAACRARQQRADGEGR